MAWKAVVTNAGSALLASYAEGGHTLNVVGASVASGVVDEINMRVATALTDEKDIASIINKARAGTGTKFKIQVGPASASIGAYTAHQIGLWANLDGGNLTLLALAQDSAGGVGVPLQSVSPNFAFALYITIAVSNTGEITIVIDEGAFVTMATLNEAIEDAVGDVMDEVYTKAQADELLANKADSVDVYTKTEADDLLDDKADSANVYTKDETYTKTEINAALGNKADSADVYTKTEADELLDDKADAKDTYTKDEVDRAIGTRAERHVFDVTVPATGWTQAGGLYSVSVNVPGMLATDSCGGAGPVQTGTEATDKEIRRAWGRVTRITAGAGSITVYASKAPEVEIPLRIEVFR